MRRNTLFWGGILVLVGVLLLLNNFLEVDLGGLIWPLFLIALGLWILWGIAAGPRSTAIEARETTIPLGDARRARLRVHHGAGRLDVDASAGPDELVTGTFGYGLDHRVKREGDTVDIKMRMAAGPFPPFFWPRMWGPAHILDWSFGLNGDIPLSLDIETGASDTHLDLTDLRVTDLRLQTGASSTTLTMPANAGHTHARIGAGAASVTIRIPSSVAARIRAEGGLASVQVDRNRFPHEGGVYRSPDYDTAPNKIDMHIETGVGSISVR